MDPFQYFMRVHTQALIIFTIFILAALAWYNVHLALAAAVVACVLYYYFRAASRHRTTVLHDYMADLYDHVEATGKIALEKLPIGIVVLEKPGTINWHNSLFGALLGKGVHFGEDLTTCFPQFPWEGLWTGDVHTVSLEHNARRYRIESFPICKADEVLALYFFDVTETEEMVESSLGLRPVIQIIQVDNYEEVMQGVEDVRRSEISAEISRVLGEWAVELRGYFKRVEKDKFILIVSQSALHQLTEDRFDILDRLRAVNIGNKIPITLSIGVAADAPNLMELGQRAQAGLDLALGRGGDQATVNIKGKLEFYGGKARAVEKTGKVKARIVAHALRDLMQDASQVIVMGHAGEDFDSLGAAIGVIKMAREAGKPAKLVVSQPSAAMSRLQDLLQDHKALEEIFITPLEAEYVAADKETLLIVVDTHRPSLVAAPKLLSRLERVVIIDHHRRSEEFIANPVLVYIEPYASSTCELVTELLQYFQDRMELDRMEATVLYAGIIVDTKNFAIQSGVRTFEAASFLRRAGADPSLVKHLFRVDFETAKNRAEIIRNTEVLFGSVAIGVCHETIKNAQITAAQSADVLLNLEGIRVSFVLCPLEDGTITISARSDGDVNVQMIMEKLGGGGHQTVAGAQLNGVTLKEARRRVVDLITAYYKESESNEGNSTARG